MQNANTAAPAGSPAFTGWCLDKEDLTPLPFVPPVVMAVFFVTMIFLYGDRQGQVGLVRMEVAGITILATIGGWGLGVDPQPKQPAGTHESKP